MGKQVEVYSTPSCHFCQQVKEFLTEHDIPYTEYDVAADGEKRQEMIEKSGQMGVPAVVIEDDILVGFDKKKLTELLEIEE
ncbi:MAG: glutaredoxin domain-containing protein [Candidatus Paceibacterota bacterium]